MKTSIFSRIFAAIVIIAFISTTIATFLTVRDQTQIFRESLVREKTVLLEQLTLELEGLSEEEIPVEVFDQISDSYEVKFFWLVKPDGEIFYADDSPLIGNTAHQFTGLNNYQREKAIYDGQEVEVMTYPVSIGENEAEWVMVMGLSLIRFTAFLGPAVIRGLLILMAATIVAVYLALTSTERIISPLMELKKAIKEIGRGKLDQEIQIQTGDEVEEIGEEFNQMTDKLRNTREELKEAKQVLEIKVRARTKELERLAENLEEEVEARTEELQRKVEELEKFHKLTVGREKKMIKLKKRNEKLREQVAKLEETLEKLKNQQQDE